MFDTLTCERSSFNVFHESVHDGPLQFTTSQYIVLDFPVTKECLHPLTQWPTPESPFVIVIFLRFPWHYFSPTVLMTDFNIFLHVYRFVLFNVDCVPFFTHYSTRRQWRSTYTYKKEWRSGNVQKGNRGKDDRSWLPVSKE